MTDLEGRALDEALAREAGCKLVKRVRYETVDPYCTCEDRAHVDRDAHEPQWLKSYHASIDDTLRDHWDELQLRGWNDMDIDIVIARNGSAVNYARLWRYENADAVMCEGATLHEAFARACLAAYREGK